MIVTYMLEEHVLIVEGLKNMADEAIYEKNIFVLKKFLCIPCETQYDSEIEAKQCVDAHQKDGELDLEAPGV